MTVRQIVMLALQLSIMSTVFGFGLKSTTADLLYLARRPALLARSLLSVFVIMPVVAVALVKLFAFPRPAEIVLIALAISPVPPLLPKKEAKAGGKASYGLGLMATLALVSIVVVPLAAAILEWYFGRPLTMPPGAIAAVVLKSALVPLAAGMVVRATFPAVARRLEDVVVLIVKLLMPASIVALLVAALPAMWAFIGSSTVLALAMFTVAGLAIGHLLGGPDPDHSVVLGLSTACRHPAIALAFASANFPDQHFGALILLYLIVSAVIGIPYVRWNNPAARAVRVAA
jgi:BASS family bile acid:Na+ symporter